MSELDLTVHEPTGPRRVRLGVDVLVIAGWAGRDQAAVESHIEELARLGVARPREIPLFYRVGASLLTTADRLQVLGAQSTGEVEAVVFNGGDGLLIGVGSDHTDRKVEAIAVSLAKQMCPKPVAPSAWRFEDVEPHWDRLILRSYRVRDGHEEPYQQGAVAALRPLRQLIDLYCERTAGGFAAGTAMFCGTVPVNGAIDWADSFHVELEDPVLNRRIVHAYSLTALPIND